MSDEAKQADNPTPGVAHDFYCTFDPCTCVPARDDALRLIYNNGGQVEVEPHYFSRHGWRFWLCRACFAPRCLHPRSAWVRSRPYGDHTYLSRNAPHFKEGW